MARLHSGCPLAFQRRSGRVSGRVMILIWHGICCVHVIARVVLYACIVCKSAEQRWGGHMQTHILNYELRLHIWDLHYGIRFYNMGFTLWDSFL